MRIISWNVNGIRAIEKKGFTNWMEQSQADCICLQEIKAFPEQVSDSLKATGSAYESFWNSAEKAGYSGTAIYTRKKPLKIISGLGIPRFDREGRVLSLDFGSFVLINAYFPNSQPDQARLGYKIDFCEEILKFCQNFVQQGKELVLCGDFNIAHCPIDLANPDKNHKSPGFLPEERAWMSQYLDSGFVDIFRKLHPNLSGQYTWWSYRTAARKRNIGWRIDYTSISKGLEPFVEKVSHENQTLGSDHCPVWLDLKVS